MQKMMNANIGSRQTPAARTDRWSKYLEAETGGLDPRKAAEYVSEVYNGSRMPESRINPILGRLDFTRYGWRETTRKAISDFEREFKEFYRISQWQPLRAFEISVQREQLRDAAFETFTAFVNACAFLAANERSVMVAPPLTLVLEYARGIDDLEIEIDIAKTMQRFVRDAKKGQFSYEKAASFLRDLSGIIS